MIRHTVTVALLPGACSVQPRAEQPAAIRASHTSEASQTPASRAASELVLAAGFEGIPESPPCATEMVLASASGRDFCIDRFEAAIDHEATSGERLPWPGNLAVDGLEQHIVAVSIAGRKPQGFISALQAELACVRADKRLCTSEEWLAACQGPEGTRYPYGNERRAGACNDRFSGQALHPVVRLFHQSAPKGTDPEEMWTRGWLNDSRLHELSHTVSAAGSFPDCRSGFGAFDMVGNLHEWVADDDGVFRGGFFMDTHQHGEGCAYRTTIHGPKYHDYSTGFRCCADLADPAE